MEKIVLIQVDPAKERQIRRLAENKKIRVLTAGEEALSHTVQQVLDGVKGQAGTSEDEESGAVEYGGDQKIQDSLLIFSDVSEKHFDKMLFEMRSKQITVDFKSVVTPTNKNWTVEQLYRELAHEKKSISETVATVQRQN